MFVAYFVGLGLILQSAFEHILNIGDWATLSCLGKLVAQDSVEAHAAGAEKRVIVDDAIVEQVDFALVNDLNGFRYVHR